MGLLDKAKAAAEQAATRAKETASELQTKRELNHAYDELGQKTFELVEAGSEVSTTALEPLLERIRTLKAQLDQGETAAAMDPDEHNAPPATAS